MDSSDDQNEKLRLAALNRYQILDSEPEQAYEEIVHKAALICDAPIAVISFVDAHRQWFKARVGIETQETPRDLSFCTHAILRPEVLEVRDASQDPRFSEKPFVKDSPGVRFYAGAPLETQDGQRLGTLCVIDDTPRNLTKDQLEALQVLAREVVTLLEARLTRKELPPTLAADADSPGDARSLRILLVDDNEDNRFLAQAFLRKHPYVIDSVGNGQLALEKFRNGAYEIILMDMQMPVMDGYAAARAIRKHEAEIGAAPTPIVALTAFALKKEQEKSVEAGCNVHLSKPIKKAHLLDIILKYANNPPATRSAHGTE